MRKRTLLAEKYDPPVKRYSWFVQKEILFKDLIKTLSKTLKIPESEFTTIQSHGGIFIDKSRISDVDLSKPLSKQCQLNIYRFLREPEDIPITDESILFDDENLLAINKPAWLPTQATRVSQTFSLEQKLKLKFKLPELMAIHRLDRQTSGVVLFSKNLKSVAALMKIFENRKIKKEYLALISEKPVQEKWIKTGYLYQDFSKNPQVVFNYSKVPFKEAKFSETHFSWEGSKSDVHLVKANLLTGRTHQIRVHLAADNYPIVADDIYGGNMSLAPRMQLHAHTLELAHPFKSSLELNIKAPLPSDFMW